MEYGLIGSAEHPADPRVAATFQDIFPRELMQPPNINSMLEQGKLFIQHLKFQSEKGS